MLNNCLSKISVVIMSLIILVGCSCVNYNEI